MRVLLILLIGLILACKTATSQTSDSTSRFASLQAYYGFIIPHSKDLGEVSNSNPFGVQIEISRLRYTQAAWNACNCYSQIGIALTYFNFNNPKELGGSLNAILFAEPKLIYGRININLRAGMGLSYITKVYDADTNPRNLFFSKQLSGILLAGLNIKTHVAPRWAMSLSVIYNHISNGGTRQPNKGMNFPAIGFGTEYIIDPHVHPLLQRTKARISDHSFRYYMGGFMASRSVNESLVSPQRKLLVGLQVGFYKPVSHMSSLGLALEGSRDGSLEEQSSQQGTSPWVVSGLLRHHLLFGRFDFSQALGVYLYKNYPNENAVFQRYAIEYNILSSLKVGFSLKAHLQVAEQMDIRTTLVF